MDEQLDALRQQLDLVERRTEQTRDRLLAEIVARIRAAFDPILRDLHDIRVSLDQVREFHAQRTPDYLPALPPTP